MSNQLCKKLVVYYSLEGNTKLIATAAAKAIGADILELKPVKELSASGFMKFFWGGKQVIFKEKPELAPFDINPLEYSFILIGTPVWAGTYAPPIKTFLTQFKLTGKKIGLFCCSGGGKRNTFTNFKNELAGNEFIGEIEFIEPLKSNKANHETSAIEWAKELASKCSIE